MGSKSRRAVWPFLLILAVLFVLSVSAPNGWRSHDPQSDTPQIAQNDSARHSHVVVPPQVLAPAPVAVNDPSQDDPLVPQAQRSAIAPKVTEKHWQDTAPELSVGTKPAIDPLASSDPLAGPSLVEIPKIELLPGNQAAKVANAGDFTAVDPTHDSVSPNTPAVVSVTPDQSPIAQPTLEPIEVSPKPLDNQIATITPQTPSIDINIKPVTPDADAQGKGQGPKSDEIKNQQPQEIKPVEPQPEPIKEPTPPSVEPEQPADAPAATIMPISLLTRLEELSKKPNCQRWSTDCIRAIHALLDQPLTKGDRDLRLDALAALTDQAAKLPAAISDPATAAEVRRLHYALYRRLEIWPVALADHAPITAIPLKLRKKTSDSLVQVQNLLMTDVNAGATWQQYLLLDILRETINDDRPNSTERLQSLARQIIARMNSNQLDASQNKFMHGAALSDLADDLRAITAVGINTHDLLVRIEQYENDRLASDGELIADATQLLICSDDAQLEQLGGKLEGHYRNANARIVVRSELVNRLIASERSEESPVVDTVAGAEVRGRAVTSTRTFVRLLPDRTKLRMGLEANGVVNSRTTASSGPATFVNQGESRFLARKLITYTENGMQVGKAEANADTMRNDVESVGTTLDSVPLFGDIARDVAMSKRDDMTGQANCETERKVAYAAGQRMDAEAGPRLAKMESDLKTKVLLPLERLQLDPKPIGLETTEQNLLLRYRLAGADQLGANTARPRAADGAWLCYQVHETAANNLIQHLDLAGRTFTPPELQVWIAEKMSRPAPKTEVLENTARFTFADDAAHVRFDGNKVILTLSIAELKQGRNHWSDFQVRATYEPEIHGLDVQLVRTGIIELIGEQFAGKPQIALRGIFGKVLSQERKIPLTPVAIAQDKRLQDLRVSQCIFEDGWLSLAMEPGRVATKSVIKK